MEFLKDKVPEECKCPILSGKYKQEEGLLNLTEKDYKYFCSLGCSVECDKFYQEFLIKKYKKEMVK